MPHSSRSVTVGIDSSNTVVTVRSIVFWWDPSKGDESFDLVLRKPRGVISAKRSIRGGVQSEPKLSELRRSEVAAMGQLALDAGRLCKVPVKTP